MKRTAKRCLSLLIALVVCVSMLPVAALADGEVVVEPAAGVQSEESATGLCLALLPLEDKAVSEGMAELTLTASGSDDICYQWQQLDISVEYETEEAREAAWTDMEGETGSALRFSDISAESFAAQKMALYRCIVTAGELMQISNEAKLLADPSWLYASEEEYDVIEKSMAVSSDADDRTDTTPDNTDGDDDPAIPVEGDDPLIPETTIELSIVSKALSKLGCPYVSAGNGENGFDCIGLVKYAYASVGTTLNRATTGNGSATWCQQGLVTQVSGGLANAQPGDILCWYADISQGGQPDHVAIYTGQIRKADISDPDVESYSVDNEGYIVDPDSTSIRADCVCALNPQRGVCLMYCGNYLGAVSGEPTHIWRYTSDIGMIIDTGSPTVTASGTCGDNLSWALYSDGLLSISGTGEMQDYSRNPSPWNSCRNIHKVIIQNGVTGIGGGAFQGCSDLSNVTIGSGVKTIGKNAFMSCGAITAVEYPGTYDQWKKITVGDGNASLTRAAVFQITFHNDAEKAKTIRYSGLVCSGSTLLECMFTAPTGKQFILWHTSRAGTGKVGNGYYPGDSVARVVSENGNNVTLYAWYKLAEYTVSYNANSGSGAPEADRKLHGESTFTLSPVKPVKDGYTFKAWNTKKDGKGTSYNAGAKYTGNKNLTLYAQWTPNTYTVRFNGNGADSGSIKSITVTKGKVSAKLPTKGFTRNGYYIVGWQSDSGAPAWEVKAGTAMTAAEVNTLTAGLNNKAIATLYAVWAPVEYSVTYKNIPTYGKASLKTADNPNPETYRTGAALNLKEPDVPGYSFKGWYSDSKLKNNAAGVSAGETGNRTFYASVTPEEYTITYELNGGTQNSKNPTKYSISKTVSLQTPSRVGYTFGGWHLKTEDHYATGALSSLKKNTYYGGNITLAASWNPITYTVKYDLSGGKNTATGRTGSYTEKHTYDESFSLPDGKNYQKAGYVFDCWKSSSDKTYTSGQSCTKLLSKTGTVTISISWRLAAYRVDYELNGGVNSSNNPTTHTVKDSAKLSNAKKTGYTFAGWYSDKSLKKQVTSVPKTANDVTLYAKWTANTVSIAFYSSDGKTVLKKTATYKSGQALPALTENEKAVTGWNTKADGSGTAYRADEAIASIAVKNGTTLKLYAIVPKNLHYELPHIWWQNDDRWRDQIYATDGGTNTTTIGRYGCLLTSIAMVESYVKAEAITPPDAISKLKMTFNTSDKVGALIHADHYAKLYISGDGLSNQLKSIYDILQNGKPVIIGGSHVEYGTHYVVVTGYTGDGKTFEAANAADFTVQDTDSWNDKDTTIATFMNGFDVLFSQGDVITYSFPTLTEIWYRE